MGSTKKQQALISLFKILEKKLWGVSLFKNLEKNKKIKILEKSCGNYIMSSKKIKKLEKSRKTEYEALDPK